MVDTQGLTHAIWITTSDVTDRNGALKCIHHNSKKLREIKVVLADGAYCGINFASAVAKKIKAGVVIAKRSEMHTFKVVPKRWVVERSFAWLEKCRPLWKNREGYLTTSLQMTNLAFLVLMLRRF